MSSLSCIRFSTLTPKLETKMDFQDFSELDGQLRMISSQFHSKMAYDFNKLIFLGLRKENTKELEEVLKMAALRDGYQGHKIFRYSQKIVSHLYIRFRNAACAEKAIVYFRAMDNKFNADIVKNILLTWYMVERMSNETVVRTLTYVDIQGKPDSPNPLSRDNVRTILIPFGYPRILHSSETIPTYTPVLFSSMAEALAATIAIGGWLSYGDGIKALKSPYRVRIVGKSKEAKIFEISGSSSEEAFAMDYFVPVSEVVEESELPEENDDGTGFTQEFESQRSRKYYGRRNPHGKRHGGKYHRTTKAGFAAESTPESNEIHGLEKQNFV